MPDGRHWDRDVIDPRELFFLSCSTVSAAHALQGSADSIAWSTVFIESHSVFDFHRERVTSRIVLGNWGTKPAQTDREMNLLSENVPITSAENQNDANPWQEYWGESYGPELKRWLLKPVFDKLEAEEKIGNLIIDVGSGASPVTQLLETKPARKRICVDIAADNVGSLDDLRIRFDAEKVGQFGALSFRKALLKVCAFLEINPKTEAKTERADTIFFSDMLNYVDFRKVLNGFANYLKPDGRIIVFNLPHRGNWSLFSDKGLKDNSQLYAFLEEHYFEIELKAFPKKPRNETDESGELIVLVARKCVLNKAIDRTEGLLLE